MYTYYIALRGNNKDLATYELETLWQVYFDETINLEEVQNILFRFTSSHKLISGHPLLKRLTFTTYMGKYYCSCKSLKELEAYLVEHKIKKPQSFLLRNRKYRKQLATLYPEKEVAEIVWEALGKPSVNIDNPQESFTTFFSSESEFHFLKDIYHNEREFLRRMPKQRPVQMPYTLKSDMARACVNYLGLKKGIILDPFCGVGGILLEARDMGFTCIGNDISWNDLKYYKENFQHYFKGQTPLRILADSRTQFLKGNSVDGIVTDIPYGKASRKLGLELYEQFLQHAKKMLKAGGRLVVIYADFVEFKELALKYFTEVKSVEEYINKSMTRHIIVLENSQ